MLGHVKFLGALQNATTTLWNALAPSDHDDELSEEALLKHIQSRWVLPIQWSHFSPKFIYVVEWHSLCQKQLYKICGVQTIVFSAYKAENHQLALGM